MMHKMTVYDMCRRTAYLKVTHNRVADKTVKIDAAPTFRLSLAEGVLSYRRFTLVTARKVSGGPYAVLKIDRRPKKPSTGARLRTAKYSSRESGRSTAHGSLMASNQPAHNFRSAGRKDRNRGLVSMACRRSPYAEVPCHLTVPLTAVASDRPT